MGFFKYVPGYHFFYFTIHVINTEGLRLIFRVLSLVPLLFPIIMSTDSCPPKTHIFSECLPGSGCKDQLIICGGVVAGGQLHPDRNLGSAENSVYPAEIIVKGTRYQKMFQENLSNKSGSFQELGF